jgi:hypothetical protein
VRREATDFDQFEAERLDLGEYAMKHSLVGEQTRQHGVVAVSGPGGRGNAERIVSPRGPRTRTW